MSQSKEPIFIIGYPKSGNTWLARICSDVFDSPIVTGDDAINQADKKDKYSGPFLIHKGHYSKKNKPEYITKESKVFYVVRDFRDVLISGYFFNHPSHDENRIVLDRERSLINFFLRAYFEHQVRRMIRRWTSHELTLLINFFKGRKNYVGNWSEHVSFWSSQPNLCIIRYEDMLNDTVLAIGMAFNSLGLDYDSNQLQEAICRQSFVKRKRDFESDHNIVNTRFLRKGVSGDWKRFLDERALKSIRRGNGLWMRRMGYDI